MLEFHVDPRVASKLDPVELALLELQFYTRIGRRLKEEKAKIY